MSDARAVTTDASQSSIDAMLQAFGLKPSAADPAQPIEVANWGRDQLPALAFALGCRRGAEIGVWEAGYTVRWLEAGLSMLAVDPWTSYPEYLDHRRHSIIPRAYQRAVARLAPYGDRATIVRAFSHEAAAEIPDESLDAVYIDANHDYENVTRDLACWTPKVRPGGLISGHDFHNFPPPRHIHVVRAVMDFTRLHQIAPWFVLGRRRTRRHEQADRYRSFLWVAP